MNDVGRLVEAAKGSTGRSFRALAEDADLAVSTLTRVKSGALDPTVDTLDRILGAAGFSLRLEVVRRGVDYGPSVGELAHAWSGGGDRVRPDWTRWRALLDRLALEPDRIPEAIYTSPPPSGHPIVDCLLAAVAEKLADDAGLRRPSWTAGVPPLPTPWQPPSRGTHHEIAPQFATRGLLVDIVSLFRERATVGA